uniref:AAA-ATPase_like domain-containing protein n=1 Tax=Caenorhabditis tropicalis TaxID=1561998 RepID=A0A1I7UPY5_9PELO
MLSVESDVLALADKDYRPFVEDYMNKLTYYLNMPNNIITSAGLTASDVSGCRIVFLVVLKGGNKNF